MGFRGRARAAAVVLLALLLVSYAAERADALERGGAEAGAAAGAGAGRRRRWLGKIKAVAKRAATHVKAVVKKVVTHAKAAVKKVVTHVKAAVARAKSAISDLFNNPPPPPPKAEPPAFVPPPPPPPAAFDDKHKLMLQRFGSCLARKDALATERTIRPGLVTYREEVYKTIPGLTDALVEGVRLQLTRSYEHTAQIVQMYEKRGRDLKPHPGVDVRGARDPEDDATLKSYYAEPDMLGDIMWSEFCKASRPCTLDENCLISSLVLVNVLGAGGRNSAPSPEGYQERPDVGVVGPYEGQLDDPNAPTAYYQPPDAPGAPTVPGTQPLATARD